jgi:hypothetical protein
MNWFGVPFPSYASCNLQRALRIEIVNGSGDAELPLDHYGPLRGVRHLSAAQDKRKAVLT